MIITYQSMRKGDSLDLVFCILLSVPHREKFILYKINGMEEYG
ncbi:hypothetical protein BAOM_2512 [Peribacillus asahii]|uniref:Uncharacterized protein n=1 Tax=Peribacillus asahii TaxID=228899 RepID=A0A3T0KSC2_9BACI|nr:hypothetical protein BAOM_2512 [Peribacillus asahii]